MTNVGFSWSFWLGFIDGLILNFLQPVHLFRHVKKDFFACEECDETFDKWMDLNVHMRIHVGKTYYR